MKNVRHLYAYDHTAKRMVEINVKAYAAFVDERLIGMSTSIDGLRRYCAKHVKDIIQDKDQGCALIYKDIHRMMDSEALLMPADKRRLLQVYSQSKKTPTPQGTI